MSVNPKPPAAEAKTKAKTKAADVPDLLPPTDDVVFKYLFGDERRKDSTACLLSAILGFEIAESDITFDDPHLKRESPDDKLGILDMFVRHKSGRKVAVEMLTGKFSNINKRLEYYISKMTTAQLGDGDNYREIKPVVFILIATEPVLRRASKYHSEFAMLEKSEHYALHDLRTLHIIELSKLPPQSQGRLAAWLEFMQTRKKEDLMALVKKHPELKPAGDALMSVSNGAAIRAWLNRDRTVEYERDVRDRIEYAVNEAVKKSVRKARRALSAERRKAKVAVATAVAAERQRAENMLALLVKQGYSADQVEKMIGKKG